jgi:hypothetical protein
MTKSFRAAKIVIAALLCPMILLGCDTVTHESLPTIRPEPVYDLLYPYYIEICAVSQIRAKFAEHGGTPGHAVMFLKGVCRDPEAPFPTIKVCDPESVDLSDPESGVGISVNKVFKNVNWMAVPGKKLFFYGNLENDEVLDKQHVQETLQAAADREVFKGIEAHERYRPLKGDTQAVVGFLAKETLGTDFALTYGRTIFCARLPVTRNMMEEIVAYLNGLNREYALGKADYNWSGYSDNCSHTLHNALAAASVWPSKSVNSFKVRQFFNLSVPANEFAELAILSNTFPLENFNKIYRDKVKRSALMKHNWLPVRHGALLKLIPIHQNNELYDTTVKIFVLQNPFLKPKSNKIGELYRDPRCREVKANLLFYKDLYESILRNRVRPWNDSRGKNQKEQARAKYYTYIEGQLADVNEKLALLGNLSK